MTKNAQLEKLQKEITEFARVRNWEQYHTPKNLAMALSVEIAELLEIFQWSTPLESSTPDESTLTHIHEEIGDVMIYLSMLAAAFGINPLDAALAKLQKNKDKYPPTTSSR